MELPKICYSKLFWTIISASFAFTFIMYNVANAQIAENREELNRRTEFVYQIPNVMSSLNDNGKVLQEISEDVNELKLDIQIIKCKTAGC